MFVRLSLKLAMLLRLELDCKLINDRHKIVGEFSDQFALIMAIYEILSRIG